MSHYHYGAVISAPLLFIIAWWCLYWDSLVVFKCVSQIWSPLLPLLKNFLPKELKCGESQTKSSFGSRRHLDLSVLFSILLSPSLPTGDQILSWCWWYWRMIRCDMSCNSYQTIMFQKGRHWERYTFIWWICFFPSECSLEERDGKRERQEKDSEERGRHWESFASLLIVNKKHECVFFHHPFYSFSQNPVIQKKLKWVPVTELSNITLSQKAPVMTISLRLALRWSWPASFATGAFLYFALHPFSPLFCQESPGRRVSSYDLPSPSFQSKNHNIRVNRSMGRRSVLTDSHPLFSTVSSLSFPSDVGTWGLWVKKEFRSRAVVSEGHNERKGGGGGCKWGIHSTCLLFLKRRRLRQERGNRRRSNKSSSLPFQFTAADSDVDPAAAGSLLMCVKESSGPSSSSCRMHVCKSPVKEERGEWTWERRTYFTF